MKILLLIIFILCVSLPVGADYPCTVGSSTGVCSGYTTTAGYSCNIKLHTGASYTGSICRTIPSSIPARFIPTATAQDLKDFLSYGGLSTTAYSCHIGGESCPRANCSPSVACAATACACTDTNTYSSQQNSSCGGSLFYAVCYRKCNSTCGGCMTNAAQPTFTVASSVRVRQLYTYHWNWTQRDSPTGTERQGIYDVTNSAVVFSSYPTSMVAVSGRNNVGWYSDFDAGSGPLLYPGITYRVTSTELYGWCNDAATSNTGVYILLLDGQP